MNGLWVCIVMGHVFVPGRNDKRGYYQRCGRCGYTRGRKHAEVAS